MVFWRVLEGLSFGKVGKNDGKSEFNLDEVSRWLWWR